MAKTKNKKKSNLADFYAKKRLEKLRKKAPNPFDMHINKVKQNVLGRKIKGDRGLPGISRSKGIAMRKNTLLVEYKLKDKNNIFLDRRIGEKNYNMTQEDKAMARFAAEKMKACKKNNIFNLNDDEVLTHRGQSLMDIEKYDDPRSDDDDYSDSENKSGKLDKKFVEDAHFGGGVLSKPDSDMSRKDIIEQLIAESKRRKVERQKIREETIDLTEKLDSEWRDLLPLVSLSNKSIEVVEQKTKPDDYDIALKELKFEARGMATDKLKPEEVIAQEEKNKLEKLEEDRLARMKGFSDDADFQRKHKSADALDDFVIEKIEVQSDEETDQFETLKKILIKKDDPQEDSEEDNDSENDDDEEEAGEEEYEEEEEEDKNKADRTLKEENVEDKDEEWEDDLSDLKASDSSEDEKEPEENFVKKAKIKDSEAIMEEARRELPHIFKVPQNYEELKDLFTNQNPHYQSIIVEKIIKCNHWKLAEKNKEKLLNLFSFLLQYLDDCFSESNVEKLTESFLIFDRFCPYFYDLTHANPDGTANILKDILKEKHTLFQSNIKVYPGLNTLILFKLVSLLYPTSDFRHPIVTPCLVFMSEILLRCKIKRKRDISRGLFISTLILEYTVLSKRWSPSVINFLRGIIYISLPKPFTQLITVIPPFKPFGEYSNILVIEKNQKKSEINPVKMQIEDLIDGEVNDLYRVRTFITAINLLLEFLENCRELDASYLIFEPVLTVLKCGSFKRYPKIVKEKVNTLVTQLETLKMKKLEHLVLDRKKPKFLRMYEPRIEVVHEGRKHKPMSKEKAEIEKLLHKVKKERKGAIRDIRKDSGFLSRVKINNQIINDNERKKKIKKIFGDAAMKI